MAPRRDWKIVEGLGYPLLSGRNTAAGRESRTIPYQIATAADLIALGETPEDYDKHFILTADIDLDPNLPGRKVFDKAVIAADTDPNDPWSPLSSRGPLSPASLTATVTYDLASDDQRQGLSGAVRRNWEFGAFTPR